MSDKFFSTIDEQIDILHSRGLQLDPAEARQWLRVIGYYRLSAYWYPYRVMEPGQKKRSDSYVEGVTFTDIVELYEFDRKLRTHIFDAIERVEVALRAAIADYLGPIAHDSYMDPENFRPGDPDKKRNLFNHAEWLTRVESRVERARGSELESVEHWFKRHPDEDLPIWILVDILDFTDISKAYMGLPTRAQWIIAEKLGIRIDLDKLTERQREKARKVHPLAGWLHQMTVIRNTCAHHGRLWNQDFIPASPVALRTIDGLQNLPENYSTNLFGALTVMTYLLETISPGSTWREKVNSLVRHYLERLPHRSPQEMGFPQGVWL